jgi:plastocyanin
LRRNASTFLVAFGFLTIGFSPPLEAAPPTGQIVGTVKAIRLSVGSALNERQKPIVYVEGIPADSTTKSQTFRVAQKNKQFHPKVLVAPVGSTVEFPNEDTILHNVFSMSPGNIFDLGLYRGDKPGSVVLKNPGVISLYCNIHPQMIAHIIVVADKHYTEVDQEGNFILSDVPAGRWELVTWFPFGRPVRQPVEVKEGHATKTDIIIRERRFPNQHDRKDGTSYSRYGK